MRRRNGRAAGLPASLLLLGLAAGCNASSGQPGGGGATGGTQGGPGTGGTVGSLCPATAGGSGGIGADGLPTCAVTTRPADPMNVYRTVDAGDAAVGDAATDAARITTVSNTSNDDNNCNMLDQVLRPDTDGGVEDCFTQTAPLCTPEPFAADDAGGGSVDGAVVEAAAGGTLIDGDYQLVRYVSNVAGGHATQRTIGIYQGATYVEWASAEKGGSAFGGDQILRLNTTMSAAGTTWKVVAVNCGSLRAAGYGYTATGTELVLYDVDSSGAAQNVYTYQRTCSR
jgi:hypothetical protein